MCVGQISLHHRLDRLQDGDLGLCTAAGLSKRDVWERMQSSRCVCVFERDQESHS